MPTRETSSTIGGVRVRRGLITFWCVVTVGCAQVTSEPPEDEIATSAPASSATAPLAEDDAATPEPPPFAPVVELADRTENSIDEPPVASEPGPAPPAVSAEDIAPEAPEPAVLASAAPAARGLEPAPVLNASSVSSATFVETLDFSALVTRLRRTKAINLRTKVAVKNESDELLEQCRAYHTQHGIVTLSDLRRSYDSLFHRLHSLLQDADPPLARDIDRSRAAIWEVLANPRKFSASGMAGA